MVLLRSTLPLDDVRTIVGTIPVGTDTLSAGCAYPTTIGSIQIKGCTIAVPLDDIGTVAGAPTVRNQALPIAVSHAITAVRPPLLRGTAVAVPLDDIRTVTGAPTVRNQALPVSGKDRISGACRRGHPRTDKSGSRYRQRDGKSASNSPTFHHAPSLHHPEGLLSVKIWMQARNPLTSRADSITWPLKVESSSTNRRGLITMTEARGTRPGKSRRRTSRV